MNKDFAFIDAQRLHAHLSIRNNEVKIGEQITFAKDNIVDSLNAFKGKYVLLGVEEDIGPRANGGMPGAMGAFKAFLTRFLNMQSNEFIDARNLMIIGRAKFDCIDTGFESLRANVSEMDEYVSGILSPIYEAGKIPILVGGGHNNAYPLIHAHFDALNRKIDVVNLDPHADFRCLEGRHSGNSFSYAMSHGLLNSYTVHGMHKAYNSAEMLGRMKEYGVSYTCFEDYLDEKASLFQDAQTYVASHTNGYGVELDLDAIALMPTSAMSPSGWSVNEARRWLRIMKNGNPRYFHFTEGAPELDTNGGNKVGKTLAYLVSDIIEK